MALWLLATKRRRRESPGASSKRLLLAQPKSETDVNPKGLRMICTVFGRHNASAVPRPAHRVPSGLRWVPACGGGEGPLPRPGHPFLDLPPPVRLFTGIGVILRLLYASATGVAAGSTAVPVTRKMETPVASGFSSVGA